MQTSLLILTVLPALSAASLQLEPVEGDGAIHNIRVKNAVQPVVRVLDAAGQPVTGAAVTFLLPEVGPGGRFGRSSTLTLTTGADGLAAARGFRPNSQVGAWEIRVVASYGGTTARAVLEQVNAAPAGAALPAASRRPVLLGILAGGAAAGLALALRGASPGAGLPVAAAAPLPTSISAGNTAIGGP